MVSWIGDLPLDLKLDLTTYLKRSNLVHHGRNLNVSPKKHKSKFVNKKITALF